MHPIAIVDDDDDVLIISSIGEWGGGFECLGGPRSWWSPPGPRIGPQIPRKPKPRVAPATRTADVDLHAPPLPVSDDRQKVFPPGLNIFQRRSYISQKFPLKVIMTLAWNAYSGAPGEVPERFSTREKFIDEGLAALADPEGRRQTYDNLVSWAEEWMWANHNSENLHDICAA